MQKSITMGMNSILNPEIYSTEEFESKYTYTGKDLGAVWTAEKTLFRVWAPTAKAVSLRLYKSGTPGADDLISQTEMTQDVCGTWITEKTGDLNGIYYTFLAELEGITNEACDPYAKTTGVNGSRAMVIDMASTNPKGWEKDADPHAGEAFTDAVIYELHIRDLSMDASSGIASKGKFLGLIESGTVNSHGIPTGLDHMKALGITHLQLQPVYDYGSVDETRLNEPQFNWGYDPVNYNVPEGSYSTDPYNGAVRVREMKQMVKGLHDNGISVVMDVVYNHVYDGGSFCFNLLVPYYFSRVNAQGFYSNGSGCGNDTASERSMVRKYIVDSVKYWADEYHIDGFRFDLVGLLDVDTINAIVTEVHKDHPNVVFYGEGWDIPTQVTKPNVAMAIQRNAHLTPKFAYFSDTLRDLLRGSVFIDNATGFASGAEVDPALLAKCFRGMPDWCPAPEHTINYASCHDNMAQFDRIQYSTPNASREDQIRMNNLAAAVYMTCQGIPFIHAGEEMLRSKPLPGGGFEHNSYRSPDSVNSMKWNDLCGEEYQQTLAYYKGLIALRKAHPALRMTDPQQINTLIHPVEGLSSRVAAFHIAHPKDEMFVVFNSSDQAVDVALPEGDWNICVCGDTAGTKALVNVVDSVSVAPISTTILVKAAETTGRTLSTRAILGGIAAAAVAIGSAVAMIVKKKKR